MSNIKFSHNCYVDISGLSVEEKEELIRYLEDLGYERRKYDYNEYQKYLAVYSDWKYNTNTKKHKQLINCGSNIPLFKAVAAINESNDYMQVFVHSGNKTYICETHDNYLQGFFETVGDEHRKATIDELFKYYGEERK